MHEDYRKPIDMPTAYYLYPCSPAFERPEHRQETYICGDNTGGGTSIPCVNDYTFWIVHNIAAVAASFCCAGLRT